MTMALSYSDDSDVTGSQSNHSGLESSVHGTPRLWIPVAPSLLNIASYSDKSRVCLFVAVDPALDARLEPCKINEPLGGADIASLAMSAFCLTHMANRAMCVPPSE